MSPGEVMSPGPGLREVLDQHSRRLVVDDRGKSVEAIPAEEDLDAGY